MARCLEGLMFKCQMVRGPNWSDVLMIKCLDGQMSGWSDVQMSEWSDVRMVRRPDGQMSKWPVVQIARYPNDYTFIKVYIMYILNVYQYSEILV